jgi:hypothetical protein
MKKLLFIVVVLVTFAAQQSKAYNSQLEAYAYSAEYTDVKWTGAINVPSVYFKLSADYQSFVNNGEQVVLSASARIDIWVYRPTTGQVFVPAWEVASLPYKTRRSFTGTYNCSVSTGDYIYWIRLIATGMQYVFQNSHGATSATGYAIAYY